jgi:cytoskeletal protein CcmA (bactofilin family)
VVINGTVIGPVHSSDFLELQPRAKVTGDVEYATIEMHLGAIVQGRLVHQGSPAKARRTQAGGQQLTLCRLEIHN